MILLLLLLLLCREWLTFNGVIYMVSVVLSFSWEVVGRRRESLRTTFHEDDDVARLVFAKGERTDSTLFHSAFDGVFGRVWVYIPMYVLNPCFLRVGGDDRSLW